MTMRHTVLFVSGLVLLSAPAAGAERLVLVAGGGTGGDGTPALKAELIQPFGVTFQGARILIVEGPGGERLRTIDDNGKIATLAGKEGVKGDEGDRRSGEDVLFNGVHAIVTGPTATAFIADTGNFRVRKYDFIDKTVTAFAGTGVKGYSGDGGPARSAKFGGCYCVAFNADQSALFITDLDNRRIRRVDMKTGFVFTAAGNGEKGVPKDGEDALKQPLVDPRAHALDREGNLWILERGGHALRVVDPKGKIRTVAGTGKPGMGTGKALEAALNGPKHLCIDYDGSVLIADTENHRILRYSPKTGLLTPVAGTGKAGKSLVEPAKKPGPPDKKPAEPDKKGEGPVSDPLKAELKQPHGVFVHPTTGELYIADTGNGRILKIQSVK
jgi:DNA-binding beta-propeller fold protein YncE